MYQEHHTYRLTILYGNPADHKEFNKHFVNVHILLMKKLHDHGIRKITFSKKDHNPDGSEPDYYLIANLYADSKKDMLHIMNGHDGKALKEDLANFATGGAKFLYGEEKDMTSIESGYHLF